MVFDQLVCISSFLMLIHSSSSPTDKYLNFFLQCALTNDLPVETDTHFFNFLWREILDNIISASHEFYFWSRFFVLESRIF